MDWASLISAGAKAVGGAIGSAKAGAGAQAGLSIDQDAYSRALAMLASGQLSYDPAQMALPAAVTTNPEDQARQASVLNRLNQASQEGYGVQDQAAINGAMNDANTNANAQRQASLARLDPNSGAAIAAGQMANQAGSNQAHDSALNIAAASRKHALDALGQYGNMTNQVRNQNDAIGQFNSKMSSQASQFNAGAQNDANQFGINSKLSALNAGSAAGHTYADELRNEGIRQGQVAGNVASGVGAVGAGIAEASKTSGNSGTDGPIGTDASGTPYYMNPDELSQYPG